MKTLIRLLAVFALVASFALAQNSPTQPGASVVRVSLYVRGPAEALTGLLYLQGGKALPLPVSPNRRGRVFPLTGVTELVVVRETKDAAGKAIRQEVGKVALPTGAKDVLLLGSLKGGALSLLPINLDVAAFPEGVLRVLNYSGDRVAVRLGPNSKMIENGSSVQLGPYAPSEIGQECSFAAQTPTQEWTTFDTRGVIFIPQARYLFIVTAPLQSGGEPDVLVIRDFVTKPSARQA